MGKRFVLVVLACVLVGLLPPGLASAERPPYGPPPHASGPPVAGCPAAAGWELVRPSGPEHLSAAFDFNLDGFVCGRLLPAFGFTLMDNVVR